MNIDLYKFSSYSSKESMNFDLPFKIMKKITMNNFCESEIVGNICKYKSEASLYLLLFNSCTVKESKELYQAQCENAMVHLFSWSELYYKTFGSIYVVKENV